MPVPQVETLKATTGGKPITYKIAYGLPVEVMLEWGLYISKPRCACILRTPATTCGRACRSCIRATLVYIQFMQRALARITDAT